MRGAANRGHRPRRRGSDRATSHDETAGSSPARRGSARRTRPTRRWWSPAQFAAPLRGAPAALCHLWLGYVALHTALSGRWWPMLLPDLAPPVLLVVLPVLLGPAAALVGPAPPRTARRWIPVAACASALALGAGQSGLDFGAWARTPAPPVPQGAVHIVAWNTQYWDQDDDPDAFYAYLRAFHADVYLLQEYLNWRADDTPVRIDDRTELRRRFPGYRIISTGELLTLSRLPVTASRALTDPEGFDSAPSGTDFPGFWHTKTLRTDIRVGSRTLSLYNAHIPVQLKLSDGVFTPAFFRAVRHQAQRRDAAWTALAHDLAGNPSPRLVAGDFNTTPAMGELSHLDRFLDRGRLTDGTLYPTSWNARSLGLWRLDFTYHDPNIHLDQYRFRDSRNLSDHDAQDLWVSAAKGQKA